MATKIKKDGKKSMKRPKLTNREIEGILREHHYLLAEDGIFDKRLKALENKIRELSYYVRCYIEFRKTDKRFDRHFKKRFEEDKKLAEKEMEKRKNELQRNETANRENLARDTENKGRRPEGVRQNG